MCQKLYSICIVEFYLATAKNEIRSFGGKEESEWSGDHHIMQNRSNSERQRASLHIHVTLAISISISIYRLYEIRTVSI